MSNDTNYKIRIRGDVAVLDSVLKYLHIKHQRWEKWQSRNSKLTGAKRKAAFDKAMKADGAAKVADFVSWGFCVEKVVKKTKKEAEALLTSWANENSLGNVWISGAEGELACLLKKYPDIKIAAKFDDDYGRGKCIGPAFQKDYGW